MANWLFIDWEYSSKLHSTIFTNNIAIAHSYTDILNFRTGTYEVSDAENVQRGTKIVLHLKGDCYDFAKEEIIKGMYWLDK